MYSVMLPGLLPRLRRHRHNPSIFLLLGAAAASMATRYKIKTCMVLSGDLSLASIAIPPPFLEGVPVGVLGIVREPVRDEIV